MAGGGSDVTNAEAKLQQAIKRAGSSGGFLGGIFGNPEKKYEDAYELCCEAANLFKINKRFDRAAEAFNKAAEMQMKLNVPHEAAKCFVDCSNMLKKHDPKAAADALLSAAQVYQRMGKLAIAAKHTQAVAELYETQLMDLEVALGNYEKAADYYEMEDAQSSANKCHIKIAHISASLERFERAMDLFEQVAKSMVDNQLLKYSAKEYFLKAGLCRMCMGDVSGAKVYAEQYQSLAASFRDSREARLLMDLITACEAEDVDQFTSVVQGYDAVSPLDQWMTSTLLVIKKSLKEEEELL